MMSISRGHFTLTILLSTAFGAATLATVEGLNKNYQIVAKQQPVMPSVADSYAPVRLQGNDGAYVIDLTDHPPSAGLQPSSGYHNRSSLVDQNGNWASLTGPQPSYQSYHHGGSRFAELPSAEQAKLDIIDLCLVTVAVTGRPANLHFKLPVSGQAFWRCSTERQAKKKARHRYARR